MTNGSGKIKKNNCTWFFNSLKFSGWGLFIFSVLALTILIISGCTKNSSTVELKSISGKTMGTTYNIKLVDDKNLSINYKLLKNEIDDLLKEINQQMSTYIENSEISRFNNYDSTGWYNISYEFASLISTSIDVSKLSDGAFDVTVGPLVNLWGFGPEIKNQEIPTAKELLEAKSKTGYNLIEVRVDSPSVKKNNPKVYLDLSAIAKGYGVDRIAEFLTSKNIENFMVEIGGEVKTTGKNNKNESWKIGIETPDYPADIKKILSISDFSVATSGDYNNYFEQNGVRYSHTIDPKTGMPVTHRLASVTVINKSCTLADAYATAIDVMGPTMGYEFALKNNLIIYMIVRADSGFKEKTTPQFAKFVSSAN